MEEKNQCPVECRMRLQTMESNIAQLWSKYNDITERGTETSRTNTKAISEIEHLQEELKKDIQRKHDKYNALFEKGDGRMNEIEKAVILQKEIIVGDVRRIMDENQAKTKNMIMMAVAVISCAVGLLRWLLP